MINRKIPQRTEQEAKSTKPLTEEDFDTRKKIIQKVGEQLMDMDYLAQSVYRYIPSSSTELIYRSHLDGVSKIYMFLMFVGFLMITAVLLYTI